MKITDILTEQEIAEMNRRDFLKGAGAAVGAAALGGAAGQAKATSKEELEAVVNVIGVLVVAQEFLQSGGSQGQDPGFDAQTNKVVGYAKASLSKWAQNRKGGREYLNQEYAAMKRNIQDARKINAKNTGNWEAQILANYKMYIQQLDDYSQF